MLVVVLVVLLACSVALNVTLWRRGLPPIAVRAFHPTREVAPPNVPMPRCAVCGIALPGGRRQHDGQWLCSAHKATHLGKV